MKLLDKITIKKWDIFICANDSGQLRIGSEHQAERRLMPNFIPSDDCWVSILGDYMEWYQLHLQEKPEGWWCNFAPTDDLPVNNKDFPFFFISRIKYKALLKQAEEYAIKKRKELGSYSNI